MYIVPWTCERSITPVCLAATGGWGWGFLRYRKEIRVGELQRRSCGATHMMSWGEGLLWWEVPSVAGVGGDLGNICLLIA